MKKLFLGSLVGVAFVYGIAVGHYEVFPYHFIKGSKRLMMTAEASPESVGRGGGVGSESREIPPGDIIYTDVSDKQEVPCDAIDMTNTMVALTFGQSNSANWGSTRYASAKSVYNFYEGRCYKATDPLLGANGEQGSVWTRLGDMLIEQGLYSNVIFVSIGMGGTTVSRWKTDGDLFQRIVEVKSQLDQRHITLTHLFWHQGERDGKYGTPKDDYKRMLADMTDGIRQLGIDAPLYVAIASRCRSPIRWGIHDAQIELIGERDDVFMGANTDAVSDMDDRYDFCHFSNTGLHKHAKLWLQAIESGDSGKYSR